MPRFITSAGVLLLVAAGCVIGGAQAQPSDVALTTASDSTSAQPAGRGRGYRGNRYRGGGHKGGNHGRPKPAHRPVYPPAPSPPPPVYSCVNPVITQLGVVSGNTGCSGTSTSCCAPYKCSTELDSSDDSVRSAQYEAKVDGSDAFSPAVNVAIVDACCILPVTDITGLVCNDAANPEYDPLYPSFPQYCKREDTPAGTTAVSDESIVDIYDANQITAGETLFNQAVLNQLACLCCSGHVFVSSSSSTGTAGAGGLLIDGRTFTSVVTCNLPSAYPIIMTQLAPWADHLTLGAGVCP